MRGILTYHSIDESGSAVSMARETFRRHVRWFCSGAVQVTTLERLLQTSDDADAVALTFDDAFDNFRHEAWPLLREHALPVTLFVPTDHAGRTNDWSGRAEPGIPSLPLMDWDAIGALAREGVTVGSHGRAHLDMRKLDPVDLSAELLCSAEKIQRETGCMPRAFAYPFGLLNERVAAAVAEIHPMACGTEFRVLRGQEDPHRLPRLDAYYFQRPGVLESWGRLRFRSYVQLRAAARRCRQSVSRVRSGPD